MIVVGARLPEAYFARHIGAKGMRAARSQYDAWFAIAKASRWRTPEHIKTSHPKASILKDGRVVFNIKGNDFRLVTMIDYAAAVVAIRFFGSHAEYDRINAETV